MDDNKIIKKMSIGTKIVRFPQLSIIAAFVLLFIVFSVGTKNFLNLNNMINVLRQASTSLIVATGMTYVLILGGIDLSVGSVACLAGTLTAGFMVNNGMPIAVAIILGIAIGTAMGFINGILIAKVRVPAFITTLAMMSTARGLALVYTGGYPITGIPDAALMLGRGYVGGIPVPVIIMLVLVSISWIILTTTSFGRHVFAAGGNEECARLSGIKVSTIKMAVYSFSGMMASVTGILLTLRLASGQPTLGDGMELDAIAAVCLGGTTLTGGKGYMFGTVIGCLFMTMMSNGFNIIEVSSFWQQVLTGVILILAVCFYERNKK